MKNKKGFTMAELLIVVAIVGVLVAISIPIFMSQLRKARLYTNKANARAAYAAAYNALMAEPSLSNFHGKKYADDNNQYCSFYYSIEDGVAVLITADDLDGWDDSNAAWIDYYKSSTGAEAIAAWEVNTRGNGGSSDKAKKGTMSDRVYSKWKIDVFKDSNSHAIGELRSICWEE